jgi:hypothetical protein
MKIVNEIVLSLPRSFIYKELHLKSDPPVQGK